MADAETTTPSTERKAGTGRARYASSRGTFQVYQDVAIQLPPAPGSVGAEGRWATPDSIDYSSLLEDAPEEAVRAGIADMITALAPGIASTRLFSQMQPEGMSLVHAWFGPNLRLFRHSQPAAGDCLYYVLAGEAHLGEQVLRAGDGFFVPSGHPLQFAAGGDGVELLEFRAGGGIHGAPGLKLHQSSMRQIEQVTETALANHRAWSTSPPRASAASDADG